MRGWEDYGLREDCLQIPIQDRFGNRIVDVVEGVGRGKVSLTTYFAAKRGLACKLQASAPAILRRRSVDLGPRPTAKPCLPVDLGDPRMLV